MVDPRPRPRVVDHAAGREKLHRERRCRACGRVGVRYLNRAHLVPKGQRGDDVDENMVPICGSGTTGCHGALTDHHPASWPSVLEGEPWYVVASALRARLQPEELDYMLFKKGQDWIERVYPV